MRILNSFIDVLSRKIKTVRNIGSRYFLSSVDKAYAHQFRNLTGNTKNKRVVVIQCVEDYYYFGLFAAICGELKRSGDVVVHQVMPRCLRPGAALNFRSFIHAHLYANWLTDQKWIRLYSCFCEKVAFRNSGMMFGLLDIRDFFLALKKWRRLDTKRRLIDLVLDQVEVGDLIYDSYLRFKPAPTVDLRDPYLLILIWQSYRNIRKAKNYFGAVNPELFLSSYSSYIHHGIPVRVALQKKIAVFSLGNYQEFLKQLSLNDWLHAKNHMGYAENWSTLSGKDEKMILADHRLSVRLDGGVDQATTYMRKSAYQNVGEPVPNVDGALVIFLHDFFDSPHGYSWMLFPDFVDWIEHTVELAIRGGIRLYLKPHPNQTPESKSVVQELVTQHPTLQILSPKITNRQLVDAGMSCGVTVYGTVAHEIVYMGVPIITCGDHPHITFDFCHTARTLEEYDRLILTHQSLSLTSPAASSEVLAFYFMHNLNMEASLAVLLDAVERYRDCIYSTAVLPAIDHFNALLSAIVSAPNFAEQIEILLDSMESLPMGQKI